MGSSHRFSVDEQIGCYRLVKFIGKRNNLRVWEVVCIVCNAKSERYPASLKQEQRQHCNKCAPPSGFTHGHSGTQSATYISWSRMLQRVRGTDPNALLSYAHVTVDPSWASFEQFLSDMGERPANTSLDRIDTFKGYCKENCRWATAKEQSRNKTNTIMLEFDGESKSLAEWAEIWSLPYRVVFERYSRFGDMTKERLSRVVAKRIKRKKG